ncbi:Anaphase-promoting complex subunit 5 [Rhodotorula toruloides]|uniref:Anaphase-promoting complex subunit 5 n=1 Tax=Rhodotorula toruloides TaxID=5286 RepID=A0A0K3CC12_RHOTO|nr:Anaphase-promoting complex subunit 5 [Rhodotorula toruloides]PRQ76187.1 hypothetical protein AAT19DRAFT_13209 [Rhodotorula toruloides]
MTATPHKLLPAAIPTLLLIQHLATSSLDSPEPHLDRLLALALECTLEADPPASLKAWLGRARGEDASEGLLAVVDHVEVTTRRLAAGGMLHTLSWLTALLEGFSLVAPSEDDELAMSTDPPPLLRSSPLGMYIRRLGIVLAKLTFEETCAWWKDFVRWVEGEKAGKRREMDPFAKARLRQDYHLSRELIRTFATNGNGDVSPQQALLHLALVEYEDGGFAEARMALEEATHIARTVGDKACLAECTSLRTRLDAASPPNAPAADSQATASEANELATDSPHDLLWEIERRRQTGDPIDTLFPLLYTSQASYQSYLFPPIPPPPTTRQPQDEAEKEKKKAQKLAGEPDSDWETGWHAAAAGLWEEMGIDSLAELHESLALEFIDLLKPSWDIKLSVLSRQARRLSSQNRHAVALQLLLTAVDTREKREGMGMKEVREWREMVWTVERDWARRSGRKHDEQAAQRFLSRPTLLAESDEDAPLYTRLSQAYTTHHRATETLSTRTRITSLLDLLELRLSSAGPGATAEAQRGLQELEKAWVEVLALHDNGEGESEELSRAREVKATLEIVLSAGEDSRLSPIVEALEAVLQNYLRLSLLPSALRVLDTLIRLADHLHLAATDADQSALWRQRRDEFAQRWIALDDALAAGTGTEQDDWSTKERWDKLARIVEQVTKAVEISIR